MININVTLPAETFNLLPDRKWIAHKRNPRIDRFFTAKTPTQATINKIIFPVKSVSQTDTDWIVYLA
jgi:hypothetical protein